MGKVTEKDVLYVAGLANLELTGEESARMVKDLNAILGHIGALAEVDTTEVAPMAQIAPLQHRTAPGRDSAAGAADSATFAYAMREDVPRPSLPRADALRNAPDPGLAGDEPAFFKVPKVIER